MAFPRIGGAGVGLGLGGALGSQSTFPTGVTSAAGFTQYPGSNAVQVAAGEIVPLPAGTFAVVCGPYTSLQFQDPVTTRWDNVGANPANMVKIIDSDGSNWRLANLTGCPVGAVVTTSGSGYTNGIGTSATGCTITVNAGGSVWVPVVGGALQYLSAASAGVQTVGSGYTFPPIAVIGPPPTGGIQATGHCVMSGGSLASAAGFVLDNQGAGYVTAPPVSLINDPRDNTGTGARVTLGVNSTFSGCLTAMYPSGAFGTASGVGGYGLPQTAAVTFTFAPVSATATAVMNFVITNTASGSSGAGYTSGVPCLLLGLPVALSSRASSDAGPIANTGLTFPRIAVGSITPAAASGSFASGTAASGVFFDAGFGYQSIPSLAIIPAGLSIAAPTAIASVSAVVGGITDTCYVQPV